MTVTTDFSSVTEVAEGRATREQLQMMRTRYLHAAARAAGRRVLELGCGAGQGLGLLASKARLVVGSDYTWSLVRQAAVHYGTRLPLLQADAQALPFREGSFDLVILFEAIYYVPDADRFVAEARRVLAPGGTLLVCSANREWSGFSASPFSTRYYSAQELRQLLARHGLEPSIAAAFDATPRGGSHRLVALLRRVAVALHLIPRTLAGRERLKRLFYGSLAPIGPELPAGGEPAEPLVPVDGNGPVDSFKVLYALGER